MSIVYQLALVLVAGAAGAIAQDSPTVISTTTIGHSFAKAAGSGSPSILKYDPNKVGNYFIGAIFAIYTIVLFYNVWKRKDRWALCLPIGCFFSCLGYFIRPSMQPFNLNITLYILQTCFVVISPATFLAFNYLLYGRMILAVDSEFGRTELNIQAMESQPLTATQKLTMIHKAGGPKREKSRFSFIPPRIVGRVFVWSDVVTFFIQVAAGGMQSAGGKGNPTLLKIGDRMFLAGVTLQGISYILFTCLLTYATLRVIRENAGKASVGGQTLILGLEVPVFALVAGLYFSSIFIIVRSIYRMIEFSQGYSGYLVSHEIYLFVLDAAPLLLAVGIWVVMWPSYLLEKILLRETKPESSLLAEYPTK